MAESGWVDGKWIAPRVVSVEDIQGSFDRIQATLRRIERRRRWRWFYTLLAFPRAYRTAYRQLRDERRRVEGS